MRKLIGILIASAALLFSASVSAADYPTEIAEPSEATVTVDGNPVDFCAYNLYGSNYFMLRDIAAALSGTDKQFNVGWKSNAVSLASETEYERIGTEFSQNADSSADAMFSVPLVKLDGTEITLVGYNINGSNYFKIRDIARIFDFSVLYEDGTLAIDTAKQYTPEAPYSDVGVIGMAHEANFALFINEMPIVSYYTAVDAAYNETQLTRINENPRLNGVYVDAANLENYGFDAAIYEDAIWLTRNKDKKFGILDGETINSAPTDISEIYASDMKVYLDGVNTRNILINDKPHISAADLLKYGNISDFKRPIGGYMGEFDTGVKIEFLKGELESAYDAAGGNEITESGRDINKNIITELGIEHMSYSGSFSYKDSAGMCKMKISYPYYYDVEYIGGLNGYVYDGTGIYTFKYDPPAGGGVATLRHYSFERGIFRDGELYDGISYVQGHEWGGFIMGKRIEGAMVNGYRRESTPLWKNTYYNDNRDDFRFGYRVDREGTVENGEYVGYYREYDVEGKLIFEGDYSDWV